MRRSGKTTRLIDHAIQVLFKEGRILAPITWDYDYMVKVGEDKLLMIDEDWKRGNRAQTDFIERLLKRLESEHRLSKYLDKRNSSGITIISLKIAT